MTSCQDRKNYLAFEIIDKLTWEKYSGSQKLPGESEQQMLWSLLIWLKQWSSQMKTQKSEGYHKTKMSESSKEY